MGGRSGCPTAGPDEIAKLLADAEAPPAVDRAPRRRRARWRQGRREPAPVGEVLGWLVAAGSGEVRDDVGPSVRWLGKVAMWAVERTARRDGPGAAATPSTYRFRARERTIVRGAVDAHAGRSRSTRRRRRRHARQCRRARPDVDARAVTRSTLTGMVDAIGRNSARRIEVPSRATVVRTGNDVTEAFLARLDGGTSTAQGARRRRARVTAPKGGPVQ